MNSEEEMRRGGVVNASGPGELQQRTRRASAARTLDRVDNMYPHNQATELGKQLWWVDVFVMSVNFRILCNLCDTVMYILSRPVCQALNSWLFATEKSLPNAEKTKIKWRECGAKPFHTRNPHTGEQTSSSIPPPLAHCSTHQPVRN
jgi:hypothetical protein